MKKKSVKPPFFSIVIPTLNEEKYISGLLSDLADQGFRDFEVIVADGKSRDKTIDVARSYNKKLPKLNYIANAPRNVSIQRNLGAGVAVGEYLVFMDADNRIPPYFLEGLHYRISMYNPDIFTTWCQSADDKPVDKSIARAFNLLIEAAKSIEFENAFGSLIGFKRLIFAKGDGFDGEMKYAEDGECVRRYARQGFSFEIFHDPQYVYSLRRYQANGTLNTLQKTAILYIRQVTGKHISRADYPMGGHVFVKSKKTLRQAIEEIQQKIKDLLAD